MGYFKQYHYEEHAKEAIVPLTTQRTAERTILSRTLKPSNTVIPIITFIHNTPITDRPTEDIDIITEDYSKKNVKGSRHFERYLEKTSEDEITSPAISQEDIENYTMKEILKNIETTKESIGLSSMTHDIVTNDVMDDDTASISPNGPIISIPTLKYVTIDDIIKDVTTSKSVKESVSDSTDGYYSSNKSEVDIVTNNIITLSNDVEENASENSIKEYERLRIDDIAVSTTPNFLVENTSAKYFSDKNNYSKDLEFEVTTNNIISTRLNSEKDRDTENSTTKHLNYEESAVTEYNATLINEIIRTKSPRSMINYTSFLDEKFSTTTKVQSVMKI